MTMDRMERSAIDIVPGWLNTAGMLGFAPPALWPISEPPIAFVTNPISYRPRSPAVDRNMTQYPGGLILHTGWPNPGYRRVLRNFRSRWARSSVPVWAHLLAEEPFEVDRMVRELEEIEGVAAVEISLPPEAIDSLRQDLVAAAVGELPLVLCVPVEQVRSEWVSRCLQMGVSAVSIGAPRGSLPSKDGTAIHGRCYGPGLLPLALQAMNYLLDLRLPIIAGCGVFDRNAYEFLLDAGAAAVKLDIVLWRGQAW